MRTWSRRVIPVIVALLVLASACAPARPAQQPTSELVKLKVVRMPFLSYAPFFIAEEEGYFAEQLLEVEFVQMAKSADSIVALIQGQVDVASGPSLVALFNAMAQGAQIKVVADRGYLPPDGCTYSAVMARKALVDEGKLAGPADCRGLRVDVDPAFFEGFWFERLLSQAGLTLEDVELMNIPPEVEAESLSKGAMDLTISSEPSVTRLGRSGAVLWKPVQEVIPNYQFGTVWFGVNLLEKNRDAGKRFMTAFLKAVRQYNQGKTDRNVEIMAKYTKLDPDLLRAACWLPFRVDGSVHLQTLREYQEWSVEKGYLETAVADEQMWDGNFVQFANEALKAQK